MNSLSKKNVRFQIMLIAVIGGFGFLCYLLFNFLVAKENERHIEDIRKVKFPILESITVARSNLVYTKDTLANAIGMEDIDLLEEADVSTEKILDALSEIAQYSPDLSHDVATLSDLLNKYYIPARSLSRQLIEDSTQLEQHQDSATKINQAYAAFRQKLLDFREKNYHIYADALSRANNEIKKGISLGLALGLFMIVILGVLAWTIANKVLSMISKSNQLKDEFLATISHELRTPMNGVNGSLELLRMSNLPEDVASYVDTAVSSSNDMMTLINHLLDFSEARSGELVRYTGRFNLRLQLALLSTKYQNKCSQKGIEFTCDMSDIAVDELVGDYQRMTYVLNQLLDNATKFTHSGRVMLSVKQAGHPDNPNQYIIQFNVCDTGIGIPPEQHRLVFEPFKQVDGSFSRTHGGLGIGLSICAKLVELMDGELTFTSIKGKGSNFSLTLPFEKADTLDKPSPINATDSPPLEQHATQLDQASETKPAAEKKRVMVVEDNAINQMVLKGILKKLGYDVITADNGKVAVNTLEKEPVDVILMDCQMPVMDGFEATRTIRNSSSPNKNKPIIAVTANVMAGDKERCLNAGMDDYLKKPIDKLIIKNKLEELTPEDSLPQQAGK